MDWKLLVKIGAIIYIMLSVVSFVTIIFVSKSLNLEIVNLKHNNEILLEKLLVTKRDIDEHTSQIQTIAAKSNEDNIRFNRAEARIDVLDTSIHPDKKRQQRLFQARDAILTHLHGGASIKECGTLDPWSVYRIAGWFIDYTDRYGVDLSLALAIARRESVFCQKALSNAGAVGIMQLMPSTADYLSTRIGISLNRFKTEDNIRMGVYYLGLLLLDFKGNTELAVKAYNTGPENVRKVIAGELSNYYTETVKYWEFISIFKQDFKEMGL